MIRIWLCLMALCACSYLPAQHYSELTWIEWADAPPALKDEFKSVMIQANETAYENITGNYHAMLDNKTRRKIYVASFDVNNDQQKEHAVITEMEKTQYSGGYHLMYYKGIGREQVRTMLNDLDVTFTAAGILYHKTPVAFYVYDKGITKVKKYVEKPAVNQKSAAAKIDDQKLSAAASLLFNNVKTKLTVYDKNVIAGACGLTLNKTKTKFIADQDKYYKVSTDVTDMNGDGVEEVFVNQSGSSFGNTGNYFDLFFKNNKGEYENVTGVIAMPLITDKIYRGYPELLMGGPGMAQNIWRYNGKIYEWNRDDRDAAINYYGVSEESAAYLAGKSKTMTATAHKSKTVAVNAESSDIGSIPGETALTGVAAYIFRNYKGTLSNADKNELVNLAAISPADTVSKGQNNNPAVKYSVYPVDFNKDGVEEIFVKATTKFLGIPTNTYFFFYKDHSGHYKAAPGKFGHGAKIIVSGQGTFPALLAKPIVSDSSGNLIIWMWNGSTYYQAQKITYTDSRRYRNIDIEDESKQYAGAL